MAHISKALLTQTCTAYHKVGISSDRQPTYDNGTELNFVKINVSEGQSSNSQGKTATDTLMMYFDTWHSSPIDYRPAINDKITYDDKDYIVVSIAKQYGFDGLEFIEVGLK